MSIEKSVFVAAWENSTGTDEYRLKKLPSGELILQRGTIVCGYGAEGKLYGKHEWRDIPTAIEE